ncbi:MAG: DUF1702 family protein [Pseudorhodoplanes sp.]
MLVERIFKLSTDEVDFDRRGHVCDDRVTRGNLETILRAFVTGYNAALASGDPTDLCRTLTRDFDAHHVGFAFEGAGMCYALFDLLAPWSTSRLRAFTDGAGLQHDYIATVGAGFAIARVPWGRRLLDRYLHRLEPTMAWCVIDGYGFHEGYFYPARYTAAGRAPPAALPAHARQPFISGVGRSFWWTLGAAPDRIAAAIARYPAEAQGEMWCGIGVAAAYAGGIEAPTLLDLHRRAGPWSSDFLSGLPLAARMRQKGGNPSAWTDIACTALLGMTAEAAADHLAGTVDAVIAELHGQDIRLREDGYARLRDRLRHWIDARHGTTLQADHVESVRKSYAAQRP